MYVYQTILYDIAAYYCVSCISIISLEIGSSNIESPYVTQLLRYIRYHYSIIRYWNAEEDMLLCVNPTKAYILT